MEDQMRSFAYFDEKDTATPPPTYNGPVGSGIVAIEEQLSAELLKEPATWRLEPINAAAERLYQSSRDPVERLAIQRIFTKLEKCRGVCAGYRQSGSSRIHNGMGSGSRNGSESANGSGSRFGSNSRTVPGGGYASGNADSSPASNHDVTGWLKRLVNSRGSELDPTYVLQDATGKVIYHIAGSAGLNMNRYLDKQVGVIGGRRGFNRTLNLPHITADRVVVLRR